MRLDPNEWINFSMILKIKQFQDHHNQTIKDLTLFSRPLIKQLILELLQNLQVVCFYTIQMQRKGYYLLEHNLEDIWIQFSIKNNWFIFKKLIILGPFIKCYDEDGDFKNTYKLKLEQLIQPILKLFTKLDEKLIYLNLWEKMEHIKSQMPFDDYLSQFEKHYLSTNLDNFKSSYLPKIDLQNFNDEILQTTLIYELNYYLLPFNDNLKYEFEQKQQLIQNKFHKYMKQFQYIFSELTQEQIQLIKDSVINTVQDKIQIRGYANYVSYFINFNFQINTFIEKQDLFNIFIQVIQQFDNEINQFGLLLILNDILTNQQTQKYYSERSQIELQKKNQNNLSNLREIVHQQLEKFYFEMENHLQLNENLKKHIFFGLDMPLILNSLCKQLKTSYAEWYQDKSKLIKQALQTQEIFIGEQFFKSITLYVENL
ncbi:hypothetical protein pb186bvf_007216 [Paramecium bursaria]